MRAQEVCAFIGSSPIRFYTENWELERMVQLSSDAVAFAVEFRGSRSRVETGARSPRGEPIRPPDDPLGREPEQLGRHEQGNSTFG